MTLAVILAEEVRLTAGSLRAAIGQDCGRLPGLADLQLGLVVAGANIVTLVVVGVASRHGW
jgi:hypothetical protein